jgi:hypothetical protein
MPNVKKKHISKHIVHKNYKNERLNIFRNYLYDYIIYIIFQYMCEEIILLSDEPILCIAINPLIKDYYYSNYQLNSILKGKLSNKFNKIRAFGTTICNVRKCHKWFGTNHVINYFFQLIDIYNGHSKEIAIGNSTDVGYLNGNVYIIERNLDITKFKRFENDHFVNAPPTICDRLKCVFVTSTINDELYVNRLFDNKLFAIGGEFAADSVEVFNGEYWTLLEHKLDNNIACLDAVMLDNNIYILRNHCYSETCFWCTMSAVKLEYYISVYNIKSGIIDTIRFETMSMYIESIRLMIINNQLACVCLHASKTSIYLYDDDGSHWQKVAKYDGQQQIIKISECFGIKYKNKNNSILDYVVDRASAMCKSNFYKLNDWNFGSI